MKTSATVVADTLSYQGARITTMRLVYPRCIHAQMLRHTALRRNVMSSRAVPTERLLEIVRTDPYVPNDWRRNRPGMRSDTRLSGEALLNAVDEWLAARDEALRSAIKLADIGAHKQHVNRLLEPFLCVVEIVTATQDAWDNMLFWRFDQEADPEAYILAIAVKDALLGSRPITNDIHSPMAYSEDPYTCAGRIARVSYDRDTEKEPVEKTVERAKRMLAAGHIGPFEHYAWGCGATERHGAYVGWESYRHRMRLDEVAKTRRQRD